MQEDHLSSESRLSATDITLHLPITFVTNVSWKTCITRVVITVNRRNARWTETKYNQQIHYYYNIAAVVLN